MYTCMYIYTRIYGLLCVCELQLKVFSKLLEVARKLPGHMANVSLTACNVHTYMYIHYHKVIVVSTDYEYH